MYCDQQTCARAGPGNSHSNCLWNTIVNSITSAPLFFFTLRIEGIWLFSLLRVTDSWLLLTSAYPGYPLEIAPSVFESFRWVVWNLWDKPKSQLNVGFTSVSVWPITHNQPTSLVIKHKEVKSQCKIQYEGLILNNFVCF